MTEVQKVLGRRLKLQSLAEATLGHGKSANGLKAVEWWAQGLVDKVREYCIQDVRVTRELFDFALTNGGLKYKDLSDIKKIPLDILQLAQTCRASIHDPHASLLVLVMVSIQEMCEAAHPQTTY